MSTKFLSAKKNYIHKSINNVEHIMLLHDNNIGLIDAIKEVSNANEILKAGSLPRLPKRIIRVQKAISFKTRGTLITAQPGDYIAAYKRANDTSGDYYIAKIPPQVVAMALTRYTNLMKKSTEKEKNHLFDLPTSPILETTFYGVIHMGNADILYDNMNGKTALKKIIRVYKETPIRTCATDNTQKSYTQKIRPGQILALIQNQRGGYNLGFILPEDLTSIKAYYRHQERLLEKQNLLKRLISASQRQRSAS